MKRRAGLLLRGNAVSNDNSQRNSWSELSVTCSRLSHGVPSAKMTSWLSSLMWKYSSSWRYSAGIDQDG